MNPLGPTTYRVSGTIMGGGAWWPFATTICKTFEYRWRADSATGRPPTVAALAAEAMAAEDGDFSGNVELMADTTLTTTGWRADRRGHVSRPFAFTSFPSLAFYTTAQWPDHGEDWQ